MSVEVLGVLFCVYHIEDLSPRGRGVGVKSSIGKRRFW